MYLEDINIEGFKSFSEKTNMSFQPGISVIIGNNGVGKSNILDAIVWAMGENDLDRVRCCAQEEIFFSGSEQSPPAARACVELIFKGIQGGAGQIKLRREVRRNEQDGFFIDEESFPRTLYLRKLTGLGLGHALKTIIRQEQINDILLQNPVKRFESICALLGIESPEKFGGVLEKRVAECLRKYMLHLIPDAHVGLQLISSNGNKGLDIVVSLPGNRVRRAHQLSGGEKSITSLALKLALFKLLQNPFFLLDEVEPSLDYTHHKSMQAFLKEVAADTQLVMITHLRSTIELADTLHGVRTRRDGSSFMKFYFNMDERLLRLYKCC